MVFSNYIMWTISSSICLLCMTAISESVTYLWVGGLCWPHVWGIWQSLCVVPPSRFHRRTESLWAALGSQVSTSDARTRKTSCPGLASSQTSPMSSRAISQSSWKLDRGMFIDITDVILIHLHTCPRSGWGTGLNLPPTWPGSLTLTSWWRNPTTNGPGWSADHACSPGAWSVAKHRPKWRRGDHWSRKLHQIICAQSQNYGSNQYTSSEAVTALAIVALRLNYLWVLQGKFVC